MLKQIAFLTALVTGSAASAAEAVDYVGQVKPIFERRCYACHGALQQRSGLRLDTAASIRTGGDSGAAIVPGDRAASLLFEYITGSDDFRMPPEGEPLEDDQIELIGRWIDAGAEGPDGELPQPDPREHWAFRPPVRPVLPLTDAATSNNPIDAFLAAEFEQHGLKPVEPAEKHVLLRRVYLDLIGLPPTRDELHEFLADDADDAYERVVERLLASPQYGERWGRHWMDVWRYSDWYGRRNVPDVMNSYAQIWRWRDWIVESLIDDKPYDRMIVEMLAADEVAPEDETALPATGFIVRNWFKWNYHQWMRDLVEHTGKAFLGLTLNCCHCHDHKYDPISQEEYFRFRAFFEPLELRHDRIAGLADPGPFRKYVYTESYGPIGTGMIRVFDEKLDAETRMYAKGDERSVIEDIPPLSPGVPAALGGDELVIEAVALPPAAYYPGSKDFVQQEELAARRAAVEAATAALEAARQSLAAAEKQLVAAASDGSGVTENDGPSTDAPTDDDAETVTTAVADARHAVRTGEAQLDVARAELESLEAKIAADSAKFKGAPGDAAELALAAAAAERRAALKAACLDLVTSEQALASAQRKAETDEAATAEVTTAQAKCTAASEAVAAAERALAEPAEGYSPLGPVYPATSTGRRTALARWIASENNPLTARVAVNHIWMRHFGRPLVESVFDFGQNGKPPSHPELLDFLAVELMDSGWRMKQLHRLIVTSEAYRRRSDGRADDSANLAIDPDNVYLWRFPRQRMEAEVVRDSVLYACGQLDATLGGPEIDHAEGLSVPRRSLYFAHHGEGTMQFLELFDAANPCDAYRRSTSIMPQQALALANSELTAGAADHLADVLWQKFAAAAAAGASVGDIDFIVAAFEQVLSRRPSAEEIELSQTFLQKQRKLYADSKRDVGEESADAGAMIDDPHRRARVSLIRALLNHNDFVTVR